MANKREDWTQDDYVKLIDAILNGLNFYKASSSNYNAQGKLNNDAVMDIINGLADTDITGYNKLTGGEGWQEHQAKSIIKLISELQSKGLNSSDIYRYLESNNAFDKETKGAELDKLIKNDSITEWVSREISDGRITYLTKDNEGNIKPNPSQPQPDNTQPQPGDTQPSNQNFYNMLGEYDQSIQNNLMLNSNDANAQKYKADMYGALDQYQAVADASLASAEMDAYALLGQQQLELENTIAEQRMKALKSGTTSAQLATQQLANMFSAQSGAAQVANNLMQTRMQNANTFAQSRYGITQDLYSTINANQQTYANAKTQLGAVAGSYASTMDQPYAQYKAFADSALKYPDIFKDYIGSKQ